MQLKFPHNTLSYVSTEIASSNFRSLAISLCAPGEMNVSELSRVSWDKMHAEWSAKPCIVHMILKFRIKSQRSWSLSRLPFFYAGKECRGRGSEDFLHRFWNVRLFRMIAMLIKLNVLSLLIRCNSLNESHLITSDDTSVAGIEYSRDFIALDNTFHIQHASVVGFLMLGAYVSITCRCLSFTEYYCSGVRCLGITIFFVRGNAFCRFPWNFWENVFQEVFFM